MSYAYDGYDAFKEARKKGQLELIKKIERICHYTPGDELFIYEKEWLRIKEDVRKADT